MKILVTGSNGQLGMCIKDLEKNYPNYIFHFKNSKELDITKEDEIETLFLGEDYDFCINCAAYTAVDNAEEDEEQAFLVNAEAVKYLAKACKLYHTVLIHISTDFVFDGKTSKPYTEEDIPNPISVYGMSKLKGEQYVQQYLTSFFIIRTSWVYSKHGNNFVKTMLRLGNERKEISVVNNQFGSPTYAPDLAEFILKICNSNNRLFGIYNFSNEGEISWYDFAKKIFSLNNSKIKLTGIPSSEYKTPAERPEYSILNKTKIKSNFGTPINNWKVSLKKHFLNED